MIKKFKLIKEYPDSPIKGTEFTFKKDTDGFFWWDDSGVIHKDDIDNYPEFWEEVTEPETELSYTKVVNKEEFIELRKRVEQLEREVQNLKINPPNLIGKGPYTWPHPMYPPNQPWYEGTFVTTNSDKIDINDEQK